MQLATVILGGVAALSHAVIAKPVQNNNNNPIPIPQVSLRDDPSRKTTSANSAQPVQQCERDSLYDLFHEDAHTAKASRYCSKLIQASATTVTATVPFEPTTVYAQTTTVTPATTYVTATDSAQATAIVTSVVYTTVIVPTTAVVATSTVLFTDTDTFTTTAATTFTSVESVITTTTTDATSTDVQTE
ncbi:hypothetical protein PG997_014205 [Apiospora hydei]|uniref:Uncharacterized protein n=1 Tax=Apiospora hydei TaxID=1337664 RepID=A0ABR1UT50_9PEZI